jgi:RNA polymerase sigma-70 factor (ECF subfamily)
MSNVIAINAAAKQSIAAARATSDEMLLQSIAKGDRTAMHVLYSRHNVRVYRFVLRMVRDTTMAEDLVSQVFLDVWRTASQFEGRSQVSTWLLSIARFKALTALRQRKHEDIEQEDVLEIADEADTPEASLDRSNTKAILRACVAKLSPAHREIINLVYYHEKSVEEAGAIIGIPQSTVKTRMFYARKQLAELLKGAGTLPLHPPAFRRALDHPAWRGPYRTDLAERPVVCRDGQGGRCRRDRGRQARYKGPDLHHQHPPAHRPDLPQPDQARRKWRGCPARRNRRRLDAPLDAGPTG